MAEASAKTEQNIQKSSKLLNSRYKDGVRSRPTDQPLPLENAATAKQLGDCNHRRSLLPKKTTPSSSRSTKVSQEDSQHAAASVRSNAPIAHNAISNSNINRNTVTSRFIEKESLKKLETSRSLPTSRATHSKNISASLGSPSSSISLKKRPSASAPSRSSIRSDIPKSNISRFKFTSARTRIRSEYQSALPSGGTVGHYRTNSHPIAKNSAPEGTTSRPKEILCHKFPVEVNRQPLLASHQRSAPKKSLKPAMASFTGPTSAISEPEMSPNQIVQLQMVLMYLSILHCTAVETQRQWEQSAERKLRHRFDVVREEHSKMKQLVQVQKTSEAQAALVSWSRNMTSAELTAKVQLLSRIICDTWQLVNSDGEYTHIIQIFEKWLDIARAVLSSRKQSAQLMQQEIHLVEPIEDGWLLKVENMKSRLISSLRGIEYMGELPPKTDFGRLLFLFKKLLRNLVEEIGVIRAIQADIMTSEISWIQTRVDAMTQAGTVVSDDSEDSRGISGVSQ